MNPVQDWLVRGYSRDALLHSQAKVRVNRFLTIC